MAGDRDQVQEAQRARLLEGLAASIREKGLAQTQVTDVVRHARASRRTFYNHFPDKDSCFVDLATVLGEEVQAEVFKTIDPDAPLAEQIDRAIATYVEILMSDPALTITFASPSLGERIVIAQREGLERWATAVVDVVHAAAESDPALQPISFERAYMAIAGIHQSVIRALARGDDPTGLIGELQAALRVLAGVPPVRSARRRGGPRSGAGRARTSSASASAA